MASIQPIGKTLRLASGETSKWILSPEAQSDDYLDNILITVGPDGTGSGRIETTLAERFDVIEDNKNPGIDTIMAKAWPLGNVSVITQDFVKAVTAYRAVCISGNIIVTSRGV